MTLVTDLRKIFFALSFDEKRQIEGLSLFIRIIKEYYKQHKRLFLWRDNSDVYQVYVSEVMLQQTQTHRIAEKYTAFLEQLPSFEVLAKAPLVQVLAAWQGLGYNRRAKFLREAAQIIVEEYGGVLPSDPKLLEQLPGIGPATAASVAAFAYNIPTVFIETNIRTVFLHFFFTDMHDVHDKELFPLIDQTLDGQDARQWYYALMDYGVMLKKQLINPSRKSRHHVKQSKFQGSNRQIRGCVIKLLTLNHTMDYDLLISEVLLHPAIHAKSERITGVIEELISEKMLQLNGDMISISEE